VLHTFEHRFLLLRSIVTPQFPVHPAGVEPATFRLRAGGSAVLSYECVCSRSNQSGLHTSTLGRDRTFNLRFRRPALLFRLSYQCVLFWSPRPVIGERVRVRGLPELTQRASEKDPSPRPSPRVRGEGASQCAVKGLNLRPLAYQASALAG
jgi:hypothetical protein